MPFRFVRKTRRIVIGLKPVLLHSRFPLFTLLIAYAAELLWVPFQVFPFGGEPEFWGYGFVLAPPEFEDRRVVIARLDFIALEMMFTTVATYVWFYFTARGNTRVIEGK